MDMPPVVEAQEWESARRRLLVREKELTHARDALAAARRPMPWYTLTDEFDADFGVDEWHGTNAFIRTADAAGEHIFRTYFINNRGLHQQPRRRGTRQHLELSRHERAGPAGDLGGFAGELSPDSAVRVVVVARLVRVITPPRPQFEVPSAQSVFIRPSKHPEPERPRPTDAASRYLRVGQHPRAHSRHRGRPVA